MLYVCYDKQFISLMKFAVQVRKKHLIAAHHTRNNHMFAVFLSNYAVDATSEDGRIFYLAGHSECVVFFIFILQYLCVLTANVYM